MLCLASVTLRRFPLVLFQVTSQFHTSCLETFESVAPSKYSEVASIPFRTCRIILLNIFSLSSVSSVQSLSCVWLFATLGTIALQASLSITNFQSLLKLMSIKSVMPSNHLILCHPLLLLPLIFPNIRVFSSESVLRIRWPKYWSFSFSISPFNEYSGLISFRIDWFDLLAVQETIKSLRQHHCSKFFGGHLSLWSNSNVHTRLLEKP